MYENEIYSFLNDMQKNKSYKENKELILMKIKFEVIKI